MKSSLDITDGFKKSVSDTNVESLIAAHCEKYDIGPLEAVKLFTVLSRRQSLKRFLAHIELFKMTLDVPGDIAELGVFRGMGLLTWANLLESYSIGDRTKIVFGFDNWSGFNEMTEKDGDANSLAGKVEGGFNPNVYYDELLNAIDIFDKDRFISFKPRIRLVEGDIEHSIGEFVKENPGVRFSLVHFDCDMYEPTKAALEALWDKVSRGGVLIFDEYSIHDWPGETKAVDEFLESQPNLRLKTFSWTNVPGAYLVKE